MKISPFRLTPINYTLPEALDSSSVMRGVLRQVLESAGIEVVATTASPALALDILKRPADDAPISVLILDVENSALLKEAQRTAPSIHAIISFSMQENSVMNSIDALDQGAAEIISKPAAPKDPAQLTVFSKELVSKIKKLTGQAAATPTLALGPEPESIFPLRKMPAGFRPRAVAIASSTGGPKALQVFFSALGTQVSHLPIFLTQHMPKDFTASLASQIQKSSGLPSAEGKEGVVAEPGNVYVAPGDYHMLAKREGSDIVLRLNQGEQENFCRPAADSMLRSLHSIYGKDLLVVVLTGMGQDGLWGAKMIAESGGVVIAQDKASSVVWGMPGAVAREGICTQVLPLNSIADLVVRMCK